MLNPFKPPRRACRLLLSFLLLTTHCRQSIEASVAQERQNIRTSSPTMTPTKTKTQTVTRKRVKIKWKRRRRTHKWQHSNVVQTTQSDSTYCHFGAWAPQALCWFFCFCTWTNNELTWRKHHGIINLFPEARQPDFAERNLLWLTHHVHVSVLFYYDLLLTQKCTVGKKRVAFGAQTCYYNVFF